jgi:hypothetical protein
MKKVLPTNYLEEITTAARGRAMYDKLVIETIQRARDNYVSWERIGMALGVSRQAATERYAKHMTPAPGIGSHSGELWRG